MSCGCAVLAQDLQRSATTVVCTDDGWHRSAVESWHIRTSFASALFGLVVRDGSRSEVESCCRPFSFLAIFRVFFFFFGRGGGGAGVRGGGAWGFTKTSTVVRHLHTWSTVKSILRGRCV